MAVENDKDKSTLKSAESSFDLLFDTTCEVLKKHLEEKRAEPSATQLIVQIVERSGLFNNNLNAVGELPTATEKKRAQGLSLLALRVLSHLQWNLEALEENLSLQWQNFLLGEFVKMASSLDGLLQSSIDINTLDQKTAMTLIIYHRWVIRTLSQRFLPNVDKSTNIGVTAENLANENILRKVRKLGIGSSSKHKGGRIHNMRTMVVKGSLQL